MNNNNKREKEINRLNKKNKGQNQSNGMDFVVKKVQNNNIASSILEGMMVLFFFARLILIKDKEIQRRMKKKTN